MALLKAGAATDKKDQDGSLALDLAPDKTVRCLNNTTDRSRGTQSNQSLFKVRKYIVQMAEREGIDLE